MSDAIDIPQNEQNVLDLITLLRGNWPKFFRKGEEAAEAAWISMLVDEMKGFDKEVLEEAGRYLLRKRSDKFPILGQCLDACYAAKNMIEYRKPKLAIGKEGEERSKYMPGTNNRYDSLADDLIMGPQGREAARKGYAYALHEFIARKGRMYDSDYELRMIIQGTRDTIELHKGLMTGTVPSHNPAAFIRFAETIFARQEEFRVRVLGSEA